MELEIIDGKCSTDDLVVPNQLDIGKVKQYTQVHNVFPLFRTK